MKRLFTRRTAGTDAKVDRLVMEYARRSAASPLLQHTERLVLDRREGIAHLSSVGKHTAERRCSLPSAAARLLDTLPQGLLSPPLASGTDDAAARYALTLRWSDGASQRITGRYDCTGLPDGWAELAAEADTLLRFYTEGELFDPSRAAAAPGPLFYCAVEFEPHGTRYSYRSEDRTLEAGELVVVPAGPDAHELLGRIVVVQACTAEDAPYPPAQTKPVLRRATPQDILELGELV